MTKKTLGQLRLVMDCRRANRLFRLAPWCPLGSVESLCRFQLPEDSSSIFVAQEDVRDFFYRLGIDSFLSQFFGLPAIRAGDLKRAFRDASVEIPSFVANLVDDADITPTLAVLPMGFSWAFWLSQMVHVQIAKQSMPDVDDSRFLIDGQPSPEISNNSGKSYACMLYADNANHLGVDADEVNFRRNQLSIGLNGRGLASHEVVEASDRVESIGVEIDGKAGEVVPTAKRLV